MTKEAMARSALRRAVLAKAAEEAAPAYMDQGTPQTPSGTNYFGNAVRAATFPAGKGVAAAARFAQNGRSPLGGVGAVGRLFGGFGKISPAPLTGVGRYMRGLTSKGLKPRAPTGQPNGVNMQIR